jgi:uncharacterized protein
LSSALDLPAAQAAFAAAMRDPVAYAALQRAPDRVTCIETHISWVFLTGPFAYKVKKPLRLSFIDYSTADRRAALCHEELRLNRRHAPGLYLDVVPIAGSPSAPRVGATDSPPFEHALRMLQFDPRLELTHLLQSGDIAASECVALGTRIAQMHADAALADPAGSFGTPATAHRITLDNFAEIARALPGPLPAQRLEWLRGYLQRLFDACHSTMERRRREGRVREGHGDLHCGNVVRWQGALVAFDGLEFDPALRFIDVASDLAFLTMDLAAHGRDDLRLELLQAWLNESGDFDAVALLPYFECYRALVRAKVAALRAEQARGAAMESGMLAQHYLAWAESRLERAPPRLVLMAGLSGSGKTWFARSIAVELRAVTVRSDVERKRLAGLRPMEASASAPDSGIYSRDFNARTYQRLRECVASCLQGGESVVVDAASLRREERARFIEIGRAHGAQIAIVHCQAPLAVLKQRVAHRAATGTDASEATAALLDRQPAYWEGFSDDEQPLVVTIDTTDTAAIERALQRLVALHRRPPG